MIPIQNNQNILVNFRVNAATLNPFDDSCVLSGKTRTQVLAELMTEYAEATASNMPQRILERERVVKTLRNAAEKVDPSNRGNGPDQSQSAGKTRLKRKFSSFLELGSGPAGLL